jgi:anti-anti-sigma factor
MIHQQASENGIAPAVVLATVTPSENGVSSEARRLNLTVESSTGDPAIRAGGAVTLRASGGLDFNTVIVFRDAAFAAVGGKPGQLLLDLSGLVYHDTTGLNGLLAVVRVARMMGICVRVAPGPVLRATLESTGLASQIPLSA